MLSATQGVCHCPDVRRETGCDVALKYFYDDEQQRVTIVRAFVVQPKILFADEPTGNLDVATGSQLIELMLELNRTQGTMLILVTHDEALARRCNRQLRLVADRIVRARNFLPLC